MATASARHILVDTEEQCQDLKNQIDEGADFTELAGSILPVLQVRKAVTLESSVPA